MGSFSIWHWLVVLVIVALIFGTKKLRNIGSDLGGAVKGFKEGMKDANGGDKPPNPSRNSASRARPSTCKPRKSPIPEPSRLSLRAAPSGPPSFSFRAAIACLMSASLN